MTEKTHHPIKDLSFFALFSLIIGSMMGSGVFDIPQNVAHGAGAIAVLISWGITTIGMLSLAFAFVYITRKRPDIQSGVYGYAKNGFGEYVGFNVAWGYGLSAVLGNASYLIYIFATMGDFHALHFFDKGNNLVSLIGESILIWLVYALITRGIKEASIINILITTIKLLALLIVIALFIRGFSTTKFVTSLNFNDYKHLGNIFEQVKSTMLVTVWDFIGIEAACIYALRAKNMKDVARATILGVIIVILIDALISILPFGIVSAGQVGLLQTPSTAGVLSAMSEFDSSYLIKIAVIISVSGALLAWMMLATNIFYVAAEDHALPKFLAKMNRKDVPSNSLLLSTIILQVIILIAYATNSVYLAMIQLATSLILVPYIIAAIFAFKLILTEQKLHFFTLLKGSIAILFGIWLIYAGGLKYLVLSTLLYIGSTFLYVIARKERNLAIFANKTELTIFLVLLTAAIISLYLWLSGTISLY